MFLKKYFKVVISLIFFWFAISAQALTHNISTPPLAILQDSKQLIVVTTDSWDSITGQLQKFVRHNNQKPWQKIGEPLRVFVGRNGLGWAGDLDKNQLNEPIKKEGDKKSPAGVFNIGKAFGFAATSIAATKLAYIPITSSIVCVDDANSKYYGQIIDDNGVVEKDWNSAEIMSKHKSAYNQGIVVEYNTDGKIPQGGSCIFLHIADDPAKSGTSGCTAMPEKHLTNLLKWLDPKSKPVLVQLPKEEYLQVQKDWQLPNF